MKTENLTKASHSFEFFFNEIRAAHSDACKDGLQFAEIAILALIEEAAAMRTKLRRITNAADSLA